jgi:hypothetical protein
MSFAGATQHYGRIELRKRIPDVAERTLGEFVSTDPALAASRSHEVEGDAVNRHLVSTELAPAARNRATAVDARLTCWAMKPFPRYCGAAPSILGVGT